VTTRDFLATNPCHTYNRVSTDRSNRSCPYEQKKKPDNGHSCWAQAK